MRGQRQSCHLLAGNAPSKQRRVEMRTLPFLTLSRAVKTRQITFDTDNMRKKKYYRRRADVVSLTLGHSVPSALKAIMADALTGMW